MSSYVHITYIIIFHHVTARPIITAQPISKAIKVGDVNVTAVSCSAIVMGPIYYQWEKYNSSNNSWISPSRRAVNITSPELKFTVIRDEDEGVYRCIVTNDDGSVISDNATVRVYGECSVALSKPYDIICITQALLLLSSSATTLCHQKELKSI